MTYERLCLSTDRLAQAGRNVQILGHFDICAELLLSRRRVLEDFHASVSCRFRKCRVQINHHDAALGLQHCRQRLGDRFQRRQ